MSSNSIAVAAFFCEDIRTEMQGTDTILGILPDNMTVPLLPGAMPRAAIYARVAYQIDTPPKNVKLKIYWPWNPEAQTLTELSEVDLKKAADESRENNAPLATYVLRMNFVPLVFLAEGTVRVCFDVDGEETLAAVLSVHVVGKGKQPPTSPPVSTTEVTMSVPPIVS